jgi:hypothetical protein
MNKLISTNIGGMPFDSDDLRFLDTAQREVFNAIGLGLSGSSNPIIRLWGVDVVSNGLNWDISEGVVFANGEFYHVPVHSVAKEIGSDVNYWSEHITFDPAGNENFKISGTFDTYQVREVKLKDSLTDGSPGVGDHVVGGNHKPPLFSEIWASVVVTNSLQSQILNSSNNRLKQGQIFELYNGATVSHGSWTALNTPLTIGDTGVVVSGSNSFITAGGTILKITITSDVRFSSDWVKLINVNPTADTNIRVFGAGLSFDASGDIEWNSIDEQTFFILNRSSASHSCTINVLKQVGMVINIESKNI